MRTIFWDRTKVLRVAALPALLFMIFIIYYSLPNDSTGQNLPIPEEIRQGAEKEIHHDEHDSHNNNNAVKAVVDEPKQDFKIPFLDMHKMGNFEPEEEPISDGPGEGGKQYHLPSQYQHEADVSIGRYKGICVRCSDDISLTRSIPDTRMKECKHWNYPENMGLTVSVVLVFHNEGFSTLMRNVHTIFKRTPPEMIHEIILVDDCSNIEDTKEKLEKYIERWNGKVKIIRNTMREGLIRTRNLGAQEATGDVVVFLDAHCEVNRNWLPPLLAPIYRNRKTMTVPFIDGVNYKTFEYRPVYAADALVRGIWEWGFFYKEMDLSAQAKAKRESQSEPYKSPTHAGGLFAIDRKYFQELGYYDDGLHVWGGEQYELSFKVWQCGGSIEWVPCSRIGHIYRGPIPAGYHVPETCKSRFDAPYIVQKNYKRVIEVWWEDKYKEYFYTREPLVRYLDHGDISKQLEFKRKNNCKSFDWFMQFVAPDQLTKYPAPPPNVVWGAMRNLGTNTCWDSFNHGPGGSPGLSSCYGQGNQLLRLNREGQLGFGERCVDAENGNEMKILVCPEGRVDGPWEYDSETKLMHHRKKSKCLSAHGSNLVLAKCDESDNHQRWEWKESRP